MQDLEICAGIFFSDYYYYGHIKNYRCPRYCVGVN